MEVLTVIALFYFVLHFYVYILIAWGIICCLLCWVSFIRAIWQERFEEPFFIISLPVDIIRNQVSEKKRGAADPLLFLFSPIIIPLGYIIMAGIVSMIAITYIGAGILDGIFFREPVTI